MEGPVSEGGAFSSSKTALKVQKKVLGKLSTRSVAKHFISDTTSRLLDNVYRLLKDYYNKREAEKVVKCMIKMVVKVGVLLRAEQFSQEELLRLELFIKKFRQLIITAISFIQVEFSYDRSFLKKEIAATRQILLALIHPHLSEKSNQRCNTIFGAFSDDEFLDAVFRPKSKYTDIRRSISNDLNRLIDDGEL